MRSLLLALVLCLLAPPLGAQESEARQLFERGVEMIRQERWGEAETLFRASQQLVGRPSTLYNLALSLYEQRRARECLETIADLMAQSDSQTEPRYRDYAETLRARAQAEIATLELLVDPADAELSIDGAAQAGTGSRRTLVLDPGTHLVSVERAGFEAAQAELRFGRGDRLQHVVELERAIPEPATPAPASPPPAPPLTTLPSATRTEVAQPRARPSRVLPYTLLGLAGASAVAAAVTGAVAAGADGEFLQRCGGTRDCDPSLRPLKERAHDFALASDVLLLVSAAAALSGAGVLLFEPDDDAVVVRAAVSERAAALSFELDF